MPRDRSFRDRSRSRSRKSSRSRSRGYNNSNRRRQRSPSRTKEAQLAQMVHTAPTIIPGHKKLEMKANQIGALLGRGGERIKQIQAQTLASIQVISTRGDAVGIVSIVGNIDRAEAAIREVLREQGCPMAGDSRPAQAEEAIVVPRQHVALFLGTNNESLIKLNEQLGGMTRVKVLPPMTADAKFAMVEITGSDKPRAAALVKAKLQAIAFEATSNASASGFASNQPQGFSAERPMPRLPLQPVAPRPHLVSLPSMPVDPSLPSFIGSRDISAVLDVVCKWTDANATASTNIVLKAAEAFCTHLPSLLSPAQLRTWRDRQWSISMPSSPGEFEDFCNTVIDLLWVFNDETEQYEPAC